MATKCSGAGAVLLLLASAFPLAAQSPSRLAGLNRTLSLGFTSSNVSDPILREPGGGRELPVPQSASAWVENSTKIFTVGAAVNLPLG